MTEETPEIITTPEVKERAVEAGVPIEVQNKDVDRVMDWIVSGHFDGSFDKIVAAMDERRGMRKREVMEQVREVFGQDATVRVPFPSEPSDTSLSETAPEPRSIAHNAFEDNPFLRKQQDEVVTNEAETPDNDEPGDALSSVTNDVNEPVMPDQLPIERRGAIIGGLSSSDIGD